VHEWSLLLTLTIPGQQQAVAAAARVADCDAVAVQVGLATAREGWLACLPLGFDHLQHKQALQQRLARQGRCELRRLVLIVMLLLFRCTWPREEGVSGRIPALMNSTVAELHAVTPYPYMQGDS
jgi:hypothetical protein